MTCAVVNRATPIQAQHQQAVGQRKGKPTLVIQPA